jgi:hypothetical protein
MGDAGFVASREQWRRLEAPLLTVDPVLERFAAQHGIGIRRNHKDWPERSLVWGEDVHCLLQVYLASREAPTFTVWLCAWQDRDGVRYWKQETAVKARPMGEVRERLPGLLVQGRQQLIAWSETPALLEPVTGSHGRGTP